MTSRKLTVKDVHLNNRRVLIRCDFNVEIRDGHVVDNLKVQQHIPTIQYALEQGARAVILMSTLGKPQGRKVPELSMEPIAHELSALLEREVIFVHDCVGAEAAKACAHPEPGSIILLENLRFHAEEDGYGVDSEGKLYTPNERCRHAFISALSHLGDIYVNDAFKSDRHEQNASYYISLPKRVSGLFVDHEMQVLDQFCTNAGEPVVLILGGVKLSKKGELLHKLVELVDRVIIGGGLSLAFQQVLGKMTIGDTLVDESQQKLAQQFLDEAAKHKVDVYLPSDYVAQATNNDRKEVVFDQTSGIPEGFIAMDIGPETVNQYRALLREARTVLWNGPMGAIDTAVVEQDDKRTYPFEAGTAALLDELVALTSAQAANGALTLIVGGQLGYFVNHRGLARYVSHVSLDSRSWLQYLSGKQLHSYHTWLQDEEQARVRVVVLREKDYYQSDGEAYVVERPVYTPVYKRVDEQGNIIDEQPQQVVIEEQLVQPTPEQQELVPPPQPEGVYINLGAGAGDVYANVGDVNVTAEPVGLVVDTGVNMKPQHVPPPPPPGAHSQPSTVGQKGGLGFGVNVNVSGPGGEHHASATVGAKAGGKGEKKGGLLSIFS